MRHVKQPGPIDPVRIESHSAPLLQGQIELKPGTILMETLAEQLGALGLRAAALDLSGMVLGPMQFVMPTYSSSEEHVAFYSDTFKREGPIAIEEGAATYGSRDGSPFLHGHLLWHDAEGRQCGGHVLPGNSIIAAPGHIGFKGCKEVAMATCFDPETNFTLFGPVAEKEDLEMDDGDLIVAKIRPNEDLIDAIETVCRRHGVEKARFASLIGSTVGARFEDGLVIDSVPTEILALDGGITRRTDGSYDVALELGLIDAVGKIHRGRPRRGENPVLICVELFLERC